MINEDITDRLLIQALDVCEIFHTQGIFLNDKSLNEKLFKVGFKIKGDTKILTGIYINESPYNLKLYTKYILLSKEEYDMCNDISHIKPFLIEENYQQSLNVIKEIESRLNSIKNFKTYTIDKVAKQLINIYYYIN